MQFNELLSAQIFNNLIQNHIWLECKDFIPVKGAATYSFLLILLIILEKIKPQNILEFGIGQTSKITTSYVSNFQNNAKLKIIEQDEKWLETFSLKLSKHKNIELIQRNICQKIVDYTLNNKYENLEEINPNVFYYVYEDEITRTQEPKREDYLTDQEFEIEWQKWTESLKTLSQEYMSAAWGVDIENKLGKKASS
jgi:hypothetical protein